MWRWFRWAVLVFILIFLGFFFAYCYLNSRIQTENEKTTDQEFQKAKISDEVKEEDETKYYNISGKTKVQLKSQMSKLGPECDDIDCFARTDWAIDWISPISGNESCENVSVVVSVKYTLPRWVNKNQASVSLQNDWDSYMVKLKRHEENHKDIAVKWGQQFLQKIKEINQTDYKTCQELEDKIGQYHATGEIIMGCTKETNGYDKRTNHGATEGVAL